MVQSKFSQSYDIVVVGGGHNGLVAAAYLGRAGKKVLLLERNARVGGATVSEAVFPGQAARLSRYAYLVSLLPPKILSDLGITLQARRRRVASYTPYRRAGRHGGLLIGNLAAPATKASFHQLAGNTTEYGRYRQLLGLQTGFAEKVWPTLLQPLQTKAELRSRFVTPDEKRSWNALVEEPLGRLIERELDDDLLRGVVFTDAKIGAFTHAHHDSLLQNRTFLYHILGNGTGEWRVPTGGMGALVGELERVCRENGVTIRTDAAVQRLELGRDSHTVTYAADGGWHDVKARYVLVNAAPAVLDGWLGRAPALGADDEGSVFKINMLLKKLPRLRDASVRPEDAFAGTFHVDEGYAQLSAAYGQAKAGKLPQQLPFELYCHTLTDPSILSPALAAEGYHTLTLFGLDVPYFLFEKDPEGTKKEAVARYLAGLDAYLAEPLAACLATDADGNPCFEAKSPVDIARELNLPRGNIFHNALSWFYAETADEAGRWGVETDVERVYLCGSGARRGGAVSGIPGHNAAMQVLGQRF
ncbi:MAG: Beta-carotene ketolase [uncultured Cytophagales bacterium]|uniref:Pyridine nucleotide-disulfide oxidoreductase domain-containing protein 2 n=1 Tax=uncultured Cytophagales bacterium TaxID=158755 RepID=A0A6J4K0M6_9SPHI|nr:MAG: Beta-carotene ketolase [uncultured Cytophagales bacterium]